MNISNLYAFKINQVFIQCYFTLLAQLHVYYYGTYSIITFTIFKYLYFYIHVYMQLW